MNNVSHDQALDAPPCATIPLKKARWFEDEVHVHDARLKSYLRGSFPSVDVEDVVQESYLRTWIASATKPVRSAKAFLFTVAKRLALNSLRHRKKSPMVAVPDLAALDVVDESKDTVEAVAVSEEIALLAEALNSLPPRCREIIILRAYQGLSQREVATLLSISETTVGTQVYQGMLRLEAFFTKRGLIES
ncbi:RNA polymerase sigma factor [Ereboglobus luteus]|uniref:RNA polymerase sigma factor n=1 Tax=Ereboglobus luteus TaxID=1796921 RepID=UPI001374EC35|nr:RNA polymerase sigma factor [Ereboglobus luteus]